MRSKVTKIFENNGIPENHLSKEELKIYQMFPPLFNYKRVPLDELQRLEDHRYCEDGTDFQMFDSTLGSIAHTAKGAEELDGNQQQQNETNRPLTQREFPEIAVNESTNNLRKLLKDPREGSFYPTNSITQVWNAGNVGLRNTAIRGRLGTSVRGKLTATQMRSCTNTRGKSTGMIRGNSKATGSTSSLRGTNTSGKLRGTIRDKLLHSRYQETKTSAESYEEDFTEVS